MTEAESMKGGPSLDSCMAFARSSPVVRELWPEEYREAEPA